MDENSQVCKIHLQDLLYMQGRGSMKKYFSCLNSRKQFKKMSGPAQKPYLKTIEHYSHFTKNQRFSENSVFPQTRIKKAFSQLRTWLSIWWTTYLGASRIWKQSRGGCKKPKANYFLKSFISNESGFVSPNSTYFSWTVWKSPGTMFKNR